MKLSVFVSCFSIICSIWSTFGDSVDQNHIVFHHQEPQRKNRIVGGENAADGQAPFMCSLQENARHICGCAILSSKFITTAAHCVVRSSAVDLRIMVGTNSLTGNGDYYNAERLIKHEQYDILKYGYDIAVVEVSGTISFNDKVQPISFSRREAPDGALAQLTGWGKLNAASRNYPDKLQVIYLPVVSTERCRQKLGFSIENSHICTFAGAGQGACFADSGSPLVLDNELIGIVNFGMPCALGFPDAYAKVSFLADWIKSKTGL